MASRLLPVSAIPAGLWKDAKLLQLAPDLASTYHGVLQATGLLNDALSATARGDIGGESAKDAAEHFSRNFSGSCGRVQLAVLDPKDSLGESSNHFIRAFSGGSVALLDIPCGSGAGSATVLSAIAHLRKESVLPRTPLDVWLLAGDKAQPALDNAARVLSALGPLLERQAVFLHPKYVVWDMLDSVSTVKLIHAWSKDHAPPDSREYFTLTSNCSGFLQNDGNFKRAEAQIEQIMAWSAQLKSTFVWVEPSTKAATQTMLPKVVSRLWSKVKVLFGHPTGSAGPGTLQTDTEMAHPVKSDFTHRVNLTLLRLERYAP
jgi:hypothetical protein